MESTSLIQFDWTLVFQIANTLLLVLVIYLIVRFFKWLGKNRKETTERLRKIEAKIEEMESHRRD